MPHAAPSRPLLAIALLSLWPAAAAAVELPVTGDGSGTDNPDLLRPGYTDCSNCDVSGAPPVIDLDQPFFDVHWSLGLRGGYVTSTSGNRFTGSFLPSVNLSRKGLRSSFSLSAGGEFVKSTTESFRIASANVGVAGAYRLDQFTVLNASGTLTVSQDQPNLPTTVVSPQIVNGLAQGSVTRDMGRFSVGLRGSVGQTLYGPTTAAAGVLVDNSWQNNYAPGAGLRLTVPVTPVLAAFVDGSAGYQHFNGVSPSLGVRLDGITYTAKAGLSYAFDSLLTGEASVGMALRRFDAGLPDVLATLYDARLVFTPDETTTLSASFGTLVGTPGTTAGATAKVAYVAAADVRYEVNPWVTLRGTAGWTRTNPIGAGSTETSYKAGIGADYLVNEWTTASIDYVFEHADQPPAIPTDTHKVLVGVTIAR